jgi:uncharacterized membrane protein
MNEALYGNGGGGGVGAGYIVGSILVGLGAAALIVFGIMLFMKKDAAKNFVVMILIAAAALSNVMFGSTLQLIMTVVAIGLLITYFVLKEDVKEITAVEDELVDD